MALECAPGARDDQVPTGASSAAKRTAGSRHSPEPAIRTSDDVEALLLLGQEVISAVLRPARLVVLGADGPLLTVGDDRDAVGLDALGHEVAHGGLRAPLAQGQVVLVGSSLVAMPFDQGEL